MLGLLLLVTLSNAQLMCSNLLWESWFDCGNNVAPGANGCCANNQCPPGCRSYSYSCCPQVCTCVGCPYARKPLLMAMTVPQQWVGAHNYFRCRHGHPPMTWNTQVAANAQAWANNCNVAHSTSYNNNPASGENIAEGFVNPFDMVTWAYSEIKDYTPDSGAGTCAAVCGHYTAIIWKGTTAVGCGRCESRKFDVCQFALGPPNWNMATEAPNNVPRSNTPTVDEATCCNQVFGGTTSTSAPTPAPSCGVEVTTWGTWPATNPGATASMSCPPGFTGTVRRLCGSNGMWQDVDSTGCVAVIPNCPVDNGWPSTAPGATAVKACPGGTVGNNTRQCNSMGQWSQEVNTCVAPATCSDGVQNQGETGIDCGCTTCTPPCPACLVCGTINCGLHGKCVEPNPVCICNDSYTGTRCEVPPPDPCSTVNCGTYGNCVGGNCSCFGGYTGPNCTTPLAATCNDGVQNSDEAGIDCGGVIAACYACPNYMWKPSNFTACSKSCGAGVQTRTVACVNSVSGATVAATFCGNAHGFTTSEQCNIDPCPVYTWQAGTWGPCSTTCNGGNQTRTVNCYSSAGNVIVPTGCDDAMKPATSQGCNTDPCTVVARWVSGPWSTCTMTCGGGTQTRSITCQDQSNTVIASSQCDAPSSPPTLQACNLDTCDGYRWKPCPSFYPCTAQCNGGGAMVGMQFRDVFCIRDSDKASVDVNLCDNATRPSASLSICNTQPCSNYNWMADGNWGPCELQANGLMQRKRTFHCHAADGSSSIRQNCVDNAGKLPISVLPCTPGTCANVDGCPTVEIAELLNFCTVDGLNFCDASSNCGQAASDLDLSLLSVGVSAAAARQCVLDYVSSLAASDRPDPVLVQVLTGRLLAGERACGFLSGAAVPAASLLTSGLLLLLALF